MGHLQEAQSKGQGAENGRSPNRRAYTHPLLFTHLVTYCAVDSCGPWYVNKGRKELKRCGVLFTYLVTRAIYLEVANFLKTDSYINALHRFVCRSGPVCQMRKRQWVELHWSTKRTKGSASQNGSPQDQVKAEMLK